MDEHIAVDATKAGNGDQFYLIGVAVEVEDQEAFDNYYFNTVEGFFNHYDFKPSYPVIKTSDITNNLPSFKIGSGLDWLATRLAANPHAKRITVAIGWYMDCVDIGTGEMHGIKFASNFLHQYFPIVTLWRHREENDVPVSVDALVDNVTGRITDCWKEVGNKFDLRLIPNGDETYPSLSTSDIIANKLRNQFPEKTPFEVYKNISYRWLKNNVNEENEPYIVSCSVNEEHASDIVPRHHYNIHSELHYPHPVVFIQDDVLSDAERSVLRSTGLYNTAKRYAYQNGGCVTNLNINEWPYAVISGDVLIHTSDTAGRTLHHLETLSPDLDINIYGAQEFLSEVN
jgi:hypothetical protein